MRVSDISHVPGWSPKDFGLGDFYIGKTFPDLLGRFTSSTVAPAKAGAFPWACVVHGCVIS
ncbi:hypothetical protein N9F34_00880 [Alphaproteobacteria bacterium]|nr:hypothetical protein [Alphaproteobacteria bacterium]